MISFPTKTSIPDNYRRQSEISDWLPGVDALHDDYGKSLVQELFKMGRGRFNRLCFDGLCLIGSCLILLVIITYAEFFTVRNEFNIAELVTLLIFVAASFYYLYQVMFKGFWGTEEPNLTGFYTGEKPAVFQEFVEYWTWLQRTDQPILASVENNRLGVPIKAKYREYGFLSLMGNITQRAGIFPPVFLRTKSEWWFPIPGSEIEQRSNFEEKTQNTQSMSLPNFEDTKRNQNTLEAKRVSSDNNKATVLKLLDDIECRFRRDRGGKGLRCLLKNDYNELFHSIKEICLEEHESDGREICDKAFHALEHFVKNKNKKPKEPLPQQPYWKKPLSESVYKQSSSGNYPPFNTRINWLSKKIDS